MTEITSLSVTRDVRERVKKFAESKDDTYTDILSRIMDAAEDYQTIRRFARYPDTDYIYLCKSDEVDRGIDIRVMKKQHIEIEPQTMILSFDEDGELSTRMVDNGTV